VASTAAARAALVQVPFPSTSSSHPALDAYYHSYADRYREEAPEYFVPESELWELPLWAAHLSGMLRAIGWTYTFVDLAATPALAETCVEVILAATEPDDYLLFSPLAQNFGLVQAISRTLRAQGRRTVIGGNMAALATEQDADHIVRGIVSPETLLSAIAGPQALAELRVQRRGAITWTPRYDALTACGKRIPLLRLNASHGCLFNCAFCGDAWSRKLFLVDRTSLAAEVDELATLFPATKLIYLGDKSFGQSPEAVGNLLDVFATRPGYRFIVQTHFSLVDEALIESMLKLGVAIVELGFETADQQALRDVAKANGDDGRLRGVLQMLSNAGLRVVLNVLGGLPSERPSSHAKTLSFMDECTGLVWLYNLYNFVPYPLTPIFPRLRERIFDWNYAHWREDAPPVFMPFHLSVQSSWEMFLEKVACAHHAVGAPAAV
jgi:hypothetical protein